MPVHAQSFTTHRLLTQCLSSRQQLTCCFAGRAIGHNMDGETIERTVREAIASVNDNAASVDRLSSELDEHARCAYRLDQWRP